MAEIESLNGLVAVRYNVIPQAGSDISSIPVLAHFAKYIRSLEQWERASAETYIINAIYGNGVSLSITPTEGSRGFTPITFVPTDTGERRGFTSGKVQTVHLCSALDAKQKEAIKEELGLDEYPEYAPTVMKLGYFAYKGSERVLASPWPAVSVIASPERYEQAGIDAEAPLNEAMLIFTDLWQEP